MLALEPDTIHPASKSIEVKLIDWLELRVEIASQGFLVFGNEVQKGGIAFHLDNCAIMGQEGNSRCWLQALGGFSDGMFGISRCVLFVDAGDLLDVAGLTTNGNRTI